MMSPIPKLTPVNRLRMMVADGEKPSVICDIMADIGWSKSDVLDAVHNMLDGISTANLTPTEKAKFVLAGRAKPDSGVPGGWRLRGRPSSVPDLVKTANAVLKNFGMKPISYAGVEGYHG